MEKLSEIRRHNLKKLSEQFESQRAFADALDVTPGYASQLLLGSCKFGEKAARKIELQLKKPPGWLDVLHDTEGNGDYIDSYAIKEKGLSLNGQLYNIKQLEVMTVSVIAFDRAGEWREALKNHHPSDGEIMIKKITGTDLFAVPVPDDSMEDEFMADEFIVIDPHMKAEHNNYVLVKVGDRVTFRQLYDDAGEWLLRPLNRDHFKTKPLGDGHIIGVVRRKTKETVYR